MLGRDTCAVLPSRSSAAIFRFKASVLQTRRAVLNRRDGVRSHPQNSIPRGWHPWQEVRSPLWNDAGEADPDLERGKVQNLRAAVRRLNGARVEASAVFSFWAQIGQATRARGFVPGRLLREGCLMPAVGGGLCQLSNALYELALQSDLEVLERHAHSRTIAGSAAQLGRDATVAWNYVDLRFRAKQEFVIEARLTSDELGVALWASAPKPVAPFQATMTFFEARPQLHALAHSCASCGETSCFRNDANPRRTSGQTAWMPDESWPEWKDLAAHASDTDVLIAPRLDVWPSEQWKESEGVPMAALQRSRRTRRASKAGAAGSVWRAQLQANEALARVLEKRLNSDMTHVVVAQSWLPHLWMSGALGGRTFDVLLTRTPFDELAACLDQAHEFLQDATLTDFRAPASLVRAEREALGAARTIFTPHAYLGQGFGERAQLLEWQRPEVEVQHGPRDALVLSGSALARKGVYAVRDAARELKAPVVIAGRDWMGSAFWRGVEVRELPSGQSWLSHARAAVWPALVEHQPRLLLRALAAGVPVVCTPQCGLGEREGVSSVEFGDADAIINSVRPLFSATQTTNAC